LWIGGVDIIKTPKLFNNGFDRTFAGAHDKSIVDLKCFQIVQNILTIASTNISIDE
jgi:hypothetical protein